MCKMGWYWINSILILECLVHHPQLKEMEKSSPESPSTTESLFDEKYA
jgi:hypothetical protein